MKALSPAYAWLDAVRGAPKTITEARALYGTLEAPGKADNPVIIGWAKEVGLAKTFSADSIPWCGLFAAIVVKRAGWEPVKDPLWARNWAKFGREVLQKDAALGDVLVFVRDGGGHVGFYVGHDAGYFHVLGGNQSDAVTITRIAKTRCIAVRRPIWRVAQPEGVKARLLAATGAVSTNEA